MNFESALILAGDWKCYFNSDDEQEEDLHQGWGLLSAGPDSESNEWEPKIWAAWFHYCFGLCLYPICTWLIFPQSLQTIPAPIFFASGCMTERYTPMLLCEVCL